MANIKIEMIDKDFSNNYDICTLITEKYNLKLSKNEIHAPIAAKILIEYNGNIKSFLLKNPIITVDNSGNIIILTTMKWSDSIYIDDTHMKHDEIRKLKKMVKFLEWKMEIGLSFDEIFMLNSLKSQLGLIYLRKKIIDLNKGGGF